MANRKDDKGMKKFLKAIGKLVLGIVILVLLAMVGLFSYHKIQLAREAKYLEPLGELVEVGGHHISVYTEGTGDKTLVFLQGGGMPSPILEAKSLYSLLSDDYRIVVLERPGYGFSDEVDGLPSLNTILDREREALTKLQINGPYILVPHSASGIEAILWAQLYPEEVEAIIGLDMSIPAFYKAIYDEDDLDQMRAAKDDLEATVASLDSTLFLYHTFGLTRVQYHLEKELDSFRTGTLSNEEKEIYKAITYQIYPNQTMMIGMLSLPEELELISSMPKPEVPMLLFISDGTELQMDNPESWIQLQKDYVADNEEGTYIELDCGHFMHNIEYKRISKEMKAFIDHLDE